MDKPVVGTIGWLDLTVKEAGVIRDFYADVVGWRVENTQVAEYVDYTMHAEDGAAVTGVCHALGANAKLPPMWIPYFVVADLDRSLAAVARRGAEVVDGPRGMGGTARFAVIRDPAGAVCALYQA